MTNVFRSIVKKFRKTYSDDELREIIKTKGLHHIAIICDGNRRWAKKRGLSPLEGHRVGFVETLPYICSQLFAWDVHTLTFWCFSTGNMKRAPVEVDNLMNSFAQMIEALKNIAKTYQVNVTHMGKKDRIPQFLLNKIIEIEKETAHFSKHNLNLAIDYSGPDEIARTYKRILDSGTALDTISEENIMKFGDVGKQSCPSPDFLIRSSAALRTSDFMPFNTVYTELYFPEIFFPDFDRDVLQNAVLNFAHRKRTFAK